MSRKLQVPVPCASTNIIQSLADRKKLAKIEFDLLHNHDVTVSTSYLIHLLIRECDSKAIIAELAGAAK